MWCVIAFLNWKSLWWAQRQDMRKVKDVGVAEGLKMYAMRQLKPQADLAAFFLIMWSPALADGDAEKGSTSHTQAPPTGADKDDKDNEEQEEDDGSATLAVWESLQDLAVTRENDVFRTGCYQPVATHSFG